MRRFDNDDYYYNQVSGMLDDYQRMRGVRDFMYNDPRLTAIQSQLQGRIPPYVPSPAYSSSRTYTPSRTYAPSPASRTFAAPASRALTAPTPRTFSTPAYQRPQSPQSPQRSFDNEFIQQVNDILSDYERTGGVVEMMYNDPRLTTLQSYLSSSYPPYGNMDNYDHDYYVQQVAGMLNDYIGSRGVRDMMYNDPRLTQFQNYIQRA